MQQQLFYVDKEHPFQGDLHAILTLQDVCVQDGAEVFAILELCRCWPPAHANTLQLYVGLQTLRLHNVLCVCSSYS